MLALTGTPVNVIVSEAAATRRASVRVLRVRPRGGPAGRRDDRDRRAVRRAAAADPDGPVIPTDFSRHAMTLVEQYGLDDDADPDQPGVGRRRGRDPAPIGPHRRDGLPGHGHRQRGPRRRSRSSARARTRPGDGPRRRRHAAPPGAWAALDEKVGGPDVLVVDKPERSGARSCPWASAPARRSSSWSAMVVALATGVVPSVVGGPARGRGHGPAAGRLRGRRLPGDQLDDGRAGRRDDPAVDRDDPDRCRGPGRRCARRGVGRRAVRTARRAVPDHRGARAAHQQHGHGPDRDPDRGGRRGRARRLAPAGADVGDGRSGRVLPDPGRDAGRT